MGRHFGNLARVRHVVTYSLSPFEQRAFPNVLSHGLPNVWRRFSSQVFKVVPPFVGAYLLYSWGMQEFERLGIIVINVNQMINCNSDVCLVLTVQVRSFFLGMRTRLSELSCHFTSCAPNTQSRLPPWLFLSLFYYSA